MAAVMTMRAPPARVRSGPPIRRILAVFAIVLSVFAVSATPAIDVVPEPIAETISAIVPDSVESVFGAIDADAISYRTYWSGFDITLTKGEMAWLAGLGYAAASSAVCALLVVTVVGAIVCGVAAWAIWQIISYWGPRMQNGTCFTIGLRWWGGVHKQRYHWC